LGNGSNLGANPPPIGGGFGGPQALLASMLEAENSAPPPTSRRAGVVPLSAIQKQSFLNHAQKPKFLPS
jgi:hypothetical protein